MVCNGVCSCQFSRAPRAACKAILQLSCWRQTAFHSPHCQIPSAARFSSLSLGKPEGLSPVRRRAPGFINNCGPGAARLSACWELPKCCRGRCFGECSTATGAAPASSTQSASAPSAAAAAAAAAQSSSSELSHSPCSQEMHCGRCQVWPSPPH